MSDQNRESVVKKTITVKSYKLKELANIYDVSLYIMRGLIKAHTKKIGRREGYYYRTEQVQTIFGLIKLPSNINIL